MKKKFKIIPESAKNHDIGNMLFISDDGKSVCHVHAHIIDAEKALEQVQKKERKMGDYFEGLEDLLGGLKNINRMFKEDDDIGRRAAQN